MPCLQHRSNRYVFFIGVQVPQSALELGCKITGSGNPVAHIGSPSEEELKQGLALEQVRNQDAVRLVITPLHKGIHTHKNMQLTKKYIYNYNVLYLFCAGVMKSWFMIY